jgi:methyl-accepting chemotaxis protein
VTGIHLVRMLFENSRMRLRSVRFRFPVLSVRSRIMLIALIPLAGFVFNAVAYQTGVNAVARAFSSSRRAADVAEASSELKGAIAVMASSAQNFATRPSQTLIRTFNGAHAVAVNRLDSIVASLEGETAKAVVILGGELADAATSFGSLDREVARLGYSDRDGIRARLRDGGTKIENIINEDLGSVSDSSANRMLASLHQMRVYEAKFRFAHQSDMPPLFGAEHQVFDAIVGTIDAPPQLKARLHSQVNAYASAFGEWVASTNRIKPLLASIERDAVKMRPAAEAVTIAARRNAEQASANLAEAQTRTTRIMLASGSATVVVGLLFSLLIIGSINRPLGRLAAAMQRLAAGDTSTKIPDTRARDEIGAMARSVLVFRNGLVEREQLAETQRQATSAREQRSENIHAMIRRFDETVEASLANLRNAAQRLEATSIRLNGAADIVSSDALAAERRVSAASHNVTTAAGSVEELSASVGEISNQVSKSTEVAQRAVSESQRTTATMSDLSAAATRIGEVVDLIQTIAAQTNLLALNATIEAARAGEAGRGFAVVAAEVKSLSGQTARATDEIIGQVRAIQEAASGAAQAIQQVNAIVENMSGIAASVAATVDQQNDAIVAIAQGVHRASGEAQTGAAAMTRVAEASAAARTTASDVRALADALSGDAERLESEVRRFLADVQAA